jgi:hypothetical protein
MDELWLAKFHPGAICAGFCRSEVGLEEIFNSEEAFCDRIWSCNVLWNLEGILLSVVEFVSVKASKM